MKNHFKRMSQLLSRTILKNQFFFFVKTTLIYLSFIYIWKLSHPYCCFFLYRRVFDRVRRVREYGTKLSYMQITWEF